MDVTKRERGQWFRLLWEAASWPAACSSPRGPLPNGFWSINDTWSGQIVITPDADAPQWPSDPVTIHAVEVKGDSLELTVSYGGGCGDHSFMLLADAAWMESYPVQTGVRLAHDAKGDACEALLTRVLRFDLSPLKAAYAASYHGVGHHPIERAWRAFIPHALVTVLLQASSD
jgi:hypothetical protein